MADATEPAGSGLSLDAALALLASKDMVMGLLLIGSGRSRAFHASSDYDLVIVVESLQPAGGPFQVGVTWLDQRLTDLIFVPQAELAAIQRLDGPVAANSATGRIIRWLQQGRIIADRTGQIQRVRAQLLGGGVSEDPYPHVSAGGPLGSGWLVGPREEEIRAAWFSVNYNLAQTRRLLQSADPVYQATARIRMALYGPGDLLYGYFTLRGLLWQGDKAAIRHLITCDPGYWEAYQQFLAAQDLGRKFELYELVAALTVAGTLINGSGLWPAAPTAMQHPAVEALWAQLTAGQL